MNTATKHDRRYNAEERILEYVLMVASGKTWRELKKEEFKPGLRTLSETKRTHRYDRLWEVLLTVERETIHQFKKALAN